MIQSVGSSTSVIAPITPNTPSCARMQQCYANAKNEFDNSCAGHLYQKIKPYQTMIYDALYAGYYLLNIFSPQKTITDATTATTIGSAWYDPIIQVVKCIKVFAVAAVPLAFYNIYYEANRAIHSLDRIDFVLKMVNQIGWLTDIIASFMTGLKATGAIAINVSTGVSALYGVGAFFSLATMAINIKQICQNQSLASELNKIEFEQGGEGVLKHLTSKDDHFLKKHFNMPGAKLRQKIEEIRNKVLLQPENKEAILSRTMKGLWGRIKANNWSNALVILAAVVTFIGMMVLLCTPLAPLAYGLLALGAGVNVIKFFYERYAAQQFKMSLEVDSA
jgi:hypothetical protein